MVRLAQLAHLSHHSWAYDSSQVAPHLVQVLRKGLYFVPALAEVGTVVGAEAHDVEVVGPTWAHQSVVALLVEDVGVECGECCDVVVEAAAAGVAEVEYAGERTAAVVAGENMPVGPSAEGR
jgi:hypothetical protein